MITSHPLASGQHRSRVLPHAPHLCPAPWTRTVSYVVMALAEDTTGPTSFPKTVKVWRNMLGITMGDEHHGSWTSVDRPRVSGQLVVWGRLGLNRRE